MAIKPLYEENKYIFRSHAIRERRKTGLFPGVLRKRIQCPKKKKKTTLVSTLYYIRVSVPVYLCWRHFVLIYFSR